MFSYCICLLRLGSVGRFDWLLVWVVYLIVISFVRGLMLLRYFGDVVGDCFVFWVGSVLILVLVMVGVVI